MAIHSAQSGTPQYVARGSARGVRTRVWQRVAWLTVVAAALGFVVSWQRDAIRIQDGQQRIRPFLEPLQRYLAQSGTLPPVFPEYPDQEEVSPAQGRFTYVDRAVIAWARTVEQAVMVGHGPAMNLFLREDGHPVFIYEGGALHERWIPVSELKPLIALQNDLAAGRTPE